MASNSFQRLVNKLGYGRKREDMKTACVTISAEGQQRVWSFILGSQLRAHERKNLLQLKAQFVLFSQPANISLLHIFVVNPCRTTNSAQLDHT